MRYDKERVEYLLQLEKTPDVVEELIILNFGLMQKQLKKFYKLNDPDALSFAYEALNNAILTFANNHQSKFSTYASVCIYNRLGSYVRSLNTQIILSTTSYDAPLTEDGKSMLDMLESYHTADGRILDACGVADIMSVADKSIKYIPNLLHKAICREWLVSEFTLTQAELAERLECTQSYVAQVLKKYKNIIKQKLESAKND